MLSFTSLLALCLSALLHSSSAGITEVINGVTVSNCPGAMVVQGTTATYCCVGGTGFSMSFCEGFPFCSSTDTMSTTTSAMSIATPTCQTTIPLSATNFDQLVESASRSLASASGSASAAATASTGSTASSTGTGTGSQAQQTQNAAAQGIKVSSAALVGAMVFLVVV
ncbi:hypothetical protein B0A52_06080 [Exophiala mesophila]|uniref:Extracellular membrane protein CFEM domain-containing protein n=1 Tax=Exophiala mesophila TaxID=212818 RepID=A0A438N5H2_EXOME|nr:hypothetical protein B0A52_06080 [Exophiala mesophila]